MLTARSRKLTKTLHPFQNPQSVKTFELFSSSKLCVISTQSKITPFGAIWAFTNRWWRNKILYRHTMECYSILRRKKILTWVMRRDERWSYTAQWKKQSQKDKYCMVPLMWSIEESNLQEQRVEWWLPAAERRGGGGGYCLMGTKFQFHKIKRILDTGCPMLWMYLMSLQCTFKNC